MDYRIGQVNTDAIKALRYEVLWPHLENEAACTIQPDNEITTFHIAAILQENVIGVSTLIVDVNEKFKTKNQYRLRAMATSPKVRGAGVGAALINEIKSELKRKKVELLWCDARLTATGFYEKLGFKVKGKVYEVPNIGPHKLMFIEL